MKSPSDQKHSAGSEKPITKDNRVDVEHQVNAALDDVVNNMPQQTRDDIYLARQAALRVMRSSTGQTSKVAKLGLLIRSPFSKVAMPVAAAMMIALSLEYASVEPVPVLPVEMMTQDVPTEDLSLLEDLEFVTWLAENEAEALL